VPTIDEIRESFREMPNGDLSFTFTVTARASGVEINGHLVGPREQGWASATEHFGQFLARLAADDLRKRQGVASQAVREAAALACFDVPREQGLTMEQASAAFRENGLDPRTSGSWSRNGWITRYNLPNDPPWMDRRVITEKGRERLQALRPAAR
jgi:hypothetical protein